MNGLFGNSGFSPMSMENLGLLGISNPNVAEFRTPSFDQPIRPFGMAELPVHGYNLQFPGGDGTTPGDDGFGSGNPNTPNFGGGLGPIPGVSQARQDWIDPIQQLRRWVSEGRNPVTWEANQYEQNPRTGMWYDIDMLGGGG